MLAGLMDSDATPSCAICGNPAPRGQECPCEAERLELAVKQAESRAMDARLHEIRDWVISHARAHILQLFERLSSARRVAHTAYLSSLPFYSIYVQYAGQPPLHPTALHQLQVQIAEAHAELKRGVDADWRASVLRYPEVLDYFYSLVDLHLPSERDPSVARPPFAAAGYADQGFEGGRREKGAKKGRVGREAPPAPMPPVEWPGARRREPGGYMAGMGRQRGPPVAPTPPIIQAPPYGPPHDDRQYYR
ncbi:hypothetical protein SLS56_011324 [Neofusicoccum ribis]|uniref:Uncharacterized protein n=1 Tax=Neofusicoccum ribis TaxID=45134 RepID=A0ABR3SBV2_9PEZI